MNDLGFAKTAHTFCIFGMRQVTATSGKANRFAGRGDFEPLGHGFLRFDAFGTSHKINSITKGRALYVMRKKQARPIFLISECYGRLVFKSDGVFGSAAGADISIGAPMLSCARTESVKSSLPLL